MPEETEGIVTIRNEQKTIKNKCSFKKSQIECVEMSNIILEISNVMGRLNGRYITANERIIKLEERAEESSKNAIQRD